MPSLRKGIIIDLFNAQCGICCYCGKKMSLKKHGDYMATVEHITPKSKGGITKYDNVAAAHSICNARRGNMPLLIYLSKLKNDGVSFQYTR